MASERRHAVSDARLLRAIEMLKSVLDGHTYDAVAARRGVTRTAVERPVKALVAKLCLRVGIEGLSPDGTAFVLRLRNRREAILAALEVFVPERRSTTRPVAIVSSEELAQGAQRIRGRSLRPLHDQALFYLLFATGARPLEIARLEVADYLNADGSVRVTSELRAHAAISGKARPLFFMSATLDVAMDSYLAERLADKLGIGEARAYRGLDPRSPLFVSATGEGFRISTFGSEGRRRYLCRAILETYRKLFRYAELANVTPLTVRHTLASRLYERRADEDQVALLFGITGKKAVRAQFPRPRPTVTELVRELI